MILEINLILLGSFVLFAFARLIFSRIGMRAPHALLLRYAQALVLISLVVPVALSLVPAKQLPQIALHVFKSYPDDANAYSPHTRINFKPPFVRPSEIAGVMEKNESSLGGFFKDLPPQVIFYFWAIGFLIVATRLIFSLRKLNRILNRAIVYKKLGRVCVVISDQVSVPFSARFFQTQWAVLPLPILERKTDRQLALKHEFQHHRQGDTLWAVFIEILQCVFYFNPGIYFWKNTIIELQEFSCDEALTGQRGVSAREYGSCLVRVAETALESREMHVGTTCMAAVSKNPRAFKSLLKRRIEMIMQGKKSAQKLAGSLIGTITVLFTIATAYGVEQSSRNNKAVVKVDVAIQKIADQVLSQALTTEGAQAGFAIVADPQTGRILAVANIDKKNHKKGQWALSESMEPASLMKGIVVAEAIEQGVTTPTADHNCENGSYRYGDQAFHDWKAEGWPKLSTTETVANSSDICAMKIAELLGSEKLQSMFSKYGFGSLPADSSLVPTAAYGTGLRVTPLEVIEAYGAIANGGNLLTPQLSQPINGNAQVIRRVLTADHAKTMREILQQVVLNGTAKHSPSALYTTAGKTESSFSGGIMESDSTGGSQKADIAGFVGFAPAMNPRVEIYVTIFNPTNRPGASGAAHAAPVFTELADDVLKYMNVTPDKI
jgi:beta-lactamase regulating signal transducer with metallopeptidase domain